MHTASCNAAPCWHDAAYCCPHPHPHPHTSHPPPLSNDSTPQVAPPHTHTHTQKALTRSHAPTHAGSTTFQNATHLQLLSPPHTPQLSTVPFKQHKPEGGSAEVQHVPLTSTATPLPPHTPHASTLPAQHRPAASTDTPSPQHLPVTESTKPVQHVPLTSTIPSSHGTDNKTGMSQASPPHPRRHTQVLAAVSQVQRGLLHSLSTLHVHVPTTAHAC